MGLFTIIYDGDSGVLNLDLDLDAGRKVDALKTVDGLLLGVDDVDQTLVNTHLEVLTGVLVDVRSANNRVTMLVGGQRNRPTNLGIGTSHGFDDLAGRLIDDLMIEGLETNTDNLRHIVQPFT